MNKGDEDSSDDTQVLPQTPQVILDIPYIRGLYVDLHTFIACIILLFMASASTWMGDHPVKTMQGS